MENVDVMGNVENPLRIVVIHLKPAGLCTYFFVLAMISSLGTVVENVKRWI